MEWLESSALYKGSLTCPLPEMTFFNITEVPVTAPGYRLSHFPPFLDTKRMWWWTLEKVLATQRLLYPQHRHLPHFTEVYVPRLSLHPNVKFAPNKQTLGKKV